MTAHLHLAAARSGQDAASVEAASISIALADDHALLRRNLRLLLEREDGLRVVAEANDLSGVVRHVRERSPNVVVLDLGLPAGSSLETIRALRAHAPGTALVVLTMDDDPAFARRALEAGVCGFVLKEMADSDLAPAIREAAGGMRYVSPRMRKRLESVARSASEDRLTARETEVLRLAALGHTSIEIAAKLQLSPRTVETHRARIHHKLGFCSRAELVRYALRRGLLGA